MLIWGATPAGAQTAADIGRANQESERIQREQRLRQQEDIERSLENNRPDTHIDVPLPPGPKGQGEGCRDIQHINLTGALHMPEAQKQSIIGPYVGTCLGVDEIQTILSEITRYYIESGYATTRAYLPGQDLSTGVLHIDVIEGRVQDLKQEGGELFLPNAFPGVKGDVLNLRDFEQGLDQLNRLQSNNATLDIAPGNTVGESVVVIRNNAGKRWHANATADNRGTRSTGRQQVGVTASYDNFFGVNEFVSFSKLKTLPFNDHDQQSSSSNVLMSIPYGYSTFTAGYAYSHYDSSLETLGGINLHLNGDNRSLFGTIDHVVYRDQINKVMLSGTLTEKESRNYIAGQKLDVSSRQLSVLDMGATWNTAYLGGTGSFGITYSRGLKILGGLKDEPGLDDDLPHAQFDKFTLNASYFRPFSLYEHNLTWSTQLTAQGALDTLYGSEQISIGGIYSVRGFHEESMANDHGYYIRNDLTLRKNLGTAYGYDILFNPYLALDAGAVTGRAPDTPHGTLVGGAAGFSLAFGPVNFDLFTGHPLKRPDDIDNEGFTTFGRLSVSF